MERELREEIINLVDSKDLRAHLMKNQVDIPLSDYMLLVGEAPISLERKRGLLRRFPQDDWEIRCALEGANKALDRLHHIDADREILQVSLYKGSSSEYTTQCSMMKTWTARDFPAAQRGMRWYREQYEKRYLYIFEEVHEEEIRKNPKWNWKAAAREEMGRPQWFWEIYLIRTTAKSGIYKPEYLFICDPWGRIFSQKRMCSLPNAKRSNRGV